MAEVELIEESRHEGEYREAVKLLASVAGAAVSDRVDRGRSALSRGLWALASGSGRVLAEINLDAGTVLVLGVPTLNSIRFAKVLTCRVQCGCGHPKVLAGVPKSGDSYRCTHCEQTVFISVD